MRKSIGMFFGAVALDRAGSTTNGNPVYKVCFVCKQLAIIGKTAANYSFTYTLKATYGVLLPAYVSYHTTRTGRIIFDNIELQKKV